jgi:peptide/nickel transport system substrate-binding protein
MIAWFFRLTSRRPGLTRVMLHSLLVAAPGLIGICKIRGGLVRWLRLGDEMNVDHARVDPHRRQKSPVQAHVVDEFLAGRLSRRAFIRQATTVGIAMSSLGAILDACSSTPSAKSPPSSSASGKSGATILAGVAAPGNPINPNTVDDAGGVETLTICGEYLTYVDPQLNVRPWLAESWTPNSDATAWTFKIRQGVRFNDGTPMTVDDVVYTFKQQSNPQVGVNAAEIMGGYLTPDGVEKVDDTHVRFNLESGCGTWPNYGLSQGNWNACIVPNNYDYTKYETEFMATGRFKMVSYNNAIGGTFVRNPYYWGTPAKPAKLEIKYYSDQGAMTAALQAGAIDCNDAFYPAGSPQLLNGDYNIIAGKAINNDNISMRCDKGPFTNKLVRQAMALTINRPQIVQSLFKGYAQIANDHPFALAFPSTDRSVPQRVQDIAKAKQLMAQAGVPRGFSVQLASANSPGQDPELAQILKQQGALIGIDISLSILTPAEFYGQLVFGSSPWLDSTMSLVYYGPYDLPNIYLGPGLFTANTKTGTGLFNAAHFNNAQFNALSRQYIAALDLSTQRNLAGQIETLLLDETPILFPYFYQTLTATQKNVYGLLPGDSTIFYWNMTKS